MIASRAWPSTTRPRSDAAPRSVATDTSSPIVATPRPSGPRCRIDTIIVQPSSEGTALLPTSAAMPHISAPSSNAVVLLGGALRRPAEPPPVHLAGKESREPCIGHEVSPPHAPRLLGEAEEQFEARALHPERCPPGASAYDVHRAAVSHDERNPGFPAEAGQPVLLARAAHRDQEDVGPRLPDLVRDGRALLVGEVAVAVARDAKLGMEPA